ncbi:MAG TPA: hypothetical protein VIT85_00750 [Solirubrobacterales bacterium]
MGEADDSRGTAAEDVRVEAAALRRLLDLHPAQVSTEELTRELGADPEAFDQRDAVERALRELVGSGLAHRNGDFVFPSLAALRFSELLD